jgi:hypothetical protein
MMMKSIAHSRTALKYKCLTCLHLPCLHITALLDYITRSGILDSYDLHVIGGGLQWVGTALCACPALHAGVG